MNWAAAAIGWAGAGICLVTVLLHYRGKIGFSALCAGIILGNVVMVLGHLVDNQLLRHFGVVLHGCIAGVAALIWWRRVRRARKIGHSPAH